MKSPSLFLILGLFATLTGARAAGPMSTVDPTGWSAQFLEQLCTGTFALPSERAGLLGKKSNRIEKNHLYQRLDPLFGGVVVLSSDSYGVLDPRPLGPKSILECTYGGVTPKDNESGMCEFDGGNLKPLKKGDARAKTRVVYRLIYNGEVGTAANRVFEWQVSREFRLQRRSEGRMLPADVTKLKALGRNVIQPGKTIPKLYRTEAQYWRRVTGDSFAIAKGSWMQPFRDGNFHQVRNGYHLEEWPGEPDVMLEMKDDEAWIKVGRGEKAFYLPEKVRKGPDWGGVYAGGERPPVNHQISAAGACPACTDNQVELPSTFEDLETLPLEPE